MSVARVLGRLFWLSFLSWEVAIIALTTTTASARPRTTGARTRANCSIRIGHNNMWPILKDILSYMEKLSYYNNYLPSTGEKTLIFNALSGAFVILENKIIDLLQKGQRDIIMNIYPNMYNILVNNGILVDEAFDEIGFVHNARMSSHLSSSEFEVIINPTINCNLGCWYCYESHIPNSAISDSVIESIIRLFEYQHIINPYKSLHVSFFGGEPLLKPQSVVKIIEGAKEFSGKEKIYCDFNFTTNATLINELVLNSLKDIPCSFQITLDGPKELHNAVRHYKESNKGSYDTIIKNIKLILEKLSKATITIRVNFTNETLINISNILDDLEFCPRNRVSFSLHKVWQANDIDIDQSLIDSFISEAADKRFLVDYMPMELQGSVCYADRYMECVINYDGNVYKCTARDFKEENREGILNPDGSITWKIENVLKRVGQKIPSVCSKCKVLPSCFGICSQKILEQGEPDCIFSSQQEINNSIIRSLNQKYLSEKINKQYEYEKNSNS